VTFVIDHSKPSALLEANHENAAPHTTAAIAIPIRTGLSVNPASERPSALRSRISGRVRGTKSTTAAVTRPSTTPMARWMGCIIHANVLKGRSLMPDAVVSSCGQRGTR
jgi:hypothetical protein